MTNHWIDIRNADVILAIGGNNAENHPISMKWVTEAKAHGAKYIVVDPRYTRSAAVSDLYGPLRSGTDIAFFGGLWNYIFENELYHEEYVKYYTNASFLLNPDYGFDDGLFTGFDEAAGKYDKATWTYQPSGEEKPYSAIVPGEAGVPAFSVKPYSVPAMDITLQDPNCVFQKMKEHYSRYTPELVSSITGMPLDRLMEIYEIYASTGAPEKAGTILYAMGMTQHTYGSQNVRAMATTQLLLGNIGRPGGGVNALRGESNVQGSTDMAMLWHIIPAYMKTPGAGGDANLNDWLSKNTKQAGWWVHTPKYMISLLKEMYGDYATIGNDFAFDLMPKCQVGKNYSHIAMFEDMHAGSVKGLFLWGQNPAVGGPNCSFERKAMENLDWMVSVDLWETETAAFWKAPNIDSVSVHTEVFSLPAAASFEKEGSISNSGRWIQWRWKAVDPPGEAQDDAKTCTDLMLAIQDLYASEGGPIAEAITELNWDYLDEDGHVDLAKLAIAINGYTVEDGKPVANFVKLQADGTTACGNWLFSGYWTNTDSDNPIDQPTGARDDSDDARIIEGRTGDLLSGGVGSYLKWSFAWPLNRRIIYNRGATDTKGQPWNPDIPLFKWDPSAGLWSTNDIPDFGNKTTHDDGSVVEDAPPEKSLIGQGLGPFIMRPEGVSLLWAPGMADGPLPEHYEPYESPVDNQMSSQQTDPVIIEWESISRGSPEDYPIVMTTFRLTEHWQTGQLTRNLPWLVETMPKMFVELSPELAEEKGIESGDNVVIENNRGAIKAYALVTDRWKPFEVGGETVHQIGAPWHWGYTGACSVGGIANDLTPSVGDANTVIPEYKAFLVDIRKEEV